MREPRCKVCKSPNVDLYEDLRARGYTLKRIHQRSKEKGDSISFTSIKNHFARGHWEGKRVDLRIQSQKEVKEITRQTIKEKQNVLQEFNSSLNILRSIVGNLSDSIDVHSSHHKINALRGLLSEIRLTLKQVEELKNKMDIEPDLSPQKVITILSYFLEKHLTDDQILAIKKDIEKEIHLDEEGKELAEIEDST